MDAKVIRSITEKKVKNLGYTAFFTLVIFSLILGYPTLFTTSSFDVPVPRVENALMLQAGSFVPQTWEKYYLFDQDQINKLYGIKNPLIPSFIQQAFGSYQIIFDEGDVSQYSGGVGSGATGATCPISTSTFPATGTGATQGMVITYPASGVSSTCIISMARWTVGDADSPLIPVFFNDYIDEFYIIHDIPDEGDINTGSGSATCLTTDISSAGFDTGVNVTSAYNQGLVGSLTGGNIRCDPLNSQNPMGEAFGSINNYATSMALDDTFYELGVRLASRSSSTKLVTGDSFLVGWAIDAPEDHTNPFWMLQVHPKFSTKDLTTATYFDDSPEFAFHSGTVNSQKGQVVIFKEFNKTELTLGDVRVTGSIQAFTDPSNMWLRIEAKDGDYHTQNITSFRVNDRELYQYAGSLGVMHITPTLSSVSFDAKLDFNWDESENDIVTVFIGIDDNSTAGRMQVDLESFEIDGEVKYNFTDIDYINNYPQTGSSDMSVACAECENGLAGGLTEALHDFETTDSFSGLQKGEGTRAWYNSGIANFTVVSTSGVTAPSLPMPEAPTSLVATTGTSTGRINLDWSHNELNVTDYRLRVFQPTTGQYLELSTIENAESSYIVTNLETGRNYKFQVCARNGDVENPTCTISNTALSSGTPLVAGNYHVQMPRFDEEEVHGTNSMNTVCEHNPSASYQSASGNKIFIPLSSVNDNCEFTLLHSTVLQSYFNEILEPFIDTITMFATWSFGGTGSAHISDVPDDWDHSSESAEDTWQNLVTGSMGSIPNGISIFSTGFAISTTAEADFISKWDGFNYAVGLMPASSSATINSSRGATEVDGAYGNIFYRLDIDLPIADETDKIFQVKNAMGTASLSAPKICTYEPTVNGIRIKPNNHAGGAEPQCIILKVFSKLNMTNMDFQIHANATTGASTGFPLGKHYFKVFDGFYDVNSELNSATSPIIPLKGAGLLASVEKTGAFNEVIILSPDLTQSTQPYVTLFIATNTTEIDLTVQEVNNGIYTWDFKDSSDIVGTQVPNFGYDSPYTIFPNFILISNSTEEDSLIPDSPPDAITDLSATPSGTTCNLSWTLPDDNGTPITGHKILRSVDGGSFLTVVANTGSNSTTYSDLGLTIGGNYQYDVRAINSIDEAISSNIDSCVPQPTSPPTAPTGLIVTNSGIDVQLSWTAPSSGSPTGYKIERKVNGGSFFELVANTGTTATTYLDTTTDPATEYTYRISGINSFGTSPTSNEQTLLTLMAPNVPTLIASQNGNQIDLTWTQPTSDSPINGYKIEKRVNGGSFSVLVANTTTTALTYSDLVVTKPNTYGYRVSALSTIGTGGSSNVVDVVFGSHVIVMVKEQDGSGFKGGGTVIASNATFSFSKSLNTQSNAIFDNLADATSYNYTFKDYGNFVLNKTLNHIFPSGNNTETFTVFALVFDTDCPINGAGSDVRIKLNYTEFQDITDYPSTPVCDSSDKVSWSTSWFGGNVTGFSKMQADFISTRFKTNADQFQRSLIPITTSYDQNLNTITSSTFAITTSSTTTINFDLFLGEAPAGGGGGGSGSGGSSAPVESGQSAIPSTKIIIKGQLTGLSVLSRTHPFAKAGDVIQGTVTVQWEGESPMSATKIDVGDFTDIIRFDLPPFELDQKIIGLGDFANSEADIPYTIVLPPNYCSVEMGITQNCVNQELLTMPIIFEFDFEGVRYEASTNIMVDLRPIPLDIVQLQVILLGLALIISAVAGNAIRKRLSPKIKQEKRRSKKFKKRFDSS